MRRTGGSDSVVPIIGLAAVVFGVACGGDDGTPVCGPANCPGCCRDGICYAGDTDDACTFGGVACSPCPSGTSCQGAGICITTCGPGEFMYNGVCYSNGAACDFYNDQECVSRTQAMWCSPEGQIFVNDCITQCAGLAPYTCCGWDPTRGDDACLCCMTADCSGFTCEP